MVSAASPYLSELSLTGSRPQARSSPVASNQMAKLATWQDYAMDAREMRVDSHHASIGQIAGTAVGCACFGVLLGLLLFWIYRRLLRKRFSMCGIARRGRSRASRDVERGQSTVTNSNEPTRKPSLQAGSHAPSSIHSRTPLSPGHRACHSAGAFPQLLTGEARTRGPPMPLRVLRPQASEPILRMPESFYSSPCFGSSIFSSPGMPVLLSDSASMTQTTHDASGDRSSGSAIEHIWASTYRSAYPSIPLSQHQAEQEKQEQQEMLNSPSVTATLSRISHSASKSAPPRSPTLPAHEGPFHDIAKPELDRESSASNCFSHSTAYKFHKGRARSHTLIMRRSRGMSSFDESQAEAAEADVKPGQDVALDFSVPPLTSGAEDNTARAYTGRSERLLANVGTYEQFARLSQAEQERRLTGNFPVSYPFITTSERF